MFWDSEGGNHDKKFQIIVGGTREDAMDAEREKGAKGEEEKKRDTFEREVSIECKKKQFISQEWSFCKETVWAGRFKGPQKFT